MALLDLTSCVDWVAEELGLSADWERIDIALGRSREYEIMDAISCAETLGATGGGGRDSQQRLVGTLTRLEDVDLRCRWGMTS